MKLPKSVQKVVENFEKLPGIGPKTAQRLGFYLLHVPQSELDAFAESLSNLKKNTLICSRCYNIAESDPCWICGNPSRNGETLCIVEDALDVLAIERSGTFEGVYHVLHGVIDPLNSIGPDDIYIPQLRKRLHESGGFKEIILATNPTMEGEATAMYIAKEVQKINPDILLTRIGRGLPIGADLEYADESTIGRALEGRKEY